MEFNRLIKEQLLPILQKKGFEILEELNNIIRFESPNVKINVVYNSREMLCFVEIGEPKGVLYPLSDHTIKDFFGVELSLNQVTKEVFVKNLILIFNLPEGNEILNGNIKFLVSYIEKESKEYTSKLILTQMLEKASMSWNNNNYEVFINIMEKNRH